MSARNAFSCSSRLRVRRAGARARRAGFTLVELMISVSILSIVVLGVFALTVNGLQGGLIVMISHGISTGALFLLVGIVYERRHTREISEFGGLAHGMPLYATVFMITTLASIGLPGLAGFVGEFMILFGTFSSTSLGHGRLLAVLAATGVVLGAIYMLWMYQRVVFGTVGNEKNRHLPDMNAREVAYMLPLLLFVFWIGLYPHTFLRKMEASVSAVVIRVAG